MTDTSSWTASGFFPAPPPRIIAHRGLATEAPENTLLAFAKAMAVGVHYLETDVHASSDGVAMISHDDTLERVAGRRVRVNTLTAAELGRVDLGDGQALPSLAEALDAFPEARFNIDIKSAAAVEPTVRTILDANATDRVLVTSFSDARRRDAVSRLPGVATSPAFRTSARILAASKLRQGWQVRRLLSSLDALQLPERWKGVQVITPPLVRMAHAAGTEVHVWTVNEPADMSRLLDAGVDGIVTDRADLAIAVVQSRR